MSARFSVEGDVRAMRAIRAWVEAFLSGSAPGAALAPRIVLVLEELISNITKYGAKPPPRVDLILALAGSSLELTIEDDDAAFDLTALPAGAPPGTDLGPGGFGIPLVQRLMDDVAYSRLPGRNRLVLRKTLQQPLP
jgi:serine/threonine-protein kinase RsbW